jgi:cell division protein FtsB
MKQFLQSRFATLLLLAGLGLVGFMTVKIFLQKMQVDKQIAKLQARADDIKGQNEQLSDLVNYLNTPQYQEKAAREQLNLQKPGEHVVALPQTSDATVASAVTSEPSASNTQKWYDYFFAVK